jgi:hypothetical protein
MSYCKVSHDTARYYSENAVSEAAYEWVESGRVKSVICQDCNLFFSTFERAMAGTCGRCQNKLTYPWVNGKRAKWTEGPIMGEDKIEGPDLDPSDWLD